jgi:hypothetical protein
MNKLLGLVGGKPIEMSVVGNSAWGYDVSVTIADEGTWVALDKTVDLACEDIARRLEVARAMSKGQSAIW